MSDKSKLKISVNDIESCKPKTICEENQYETDDNKWVVKREL